MRDLRRTTSRYKQPNRMHSISSADPAGEFKADQCSEAVAEEGKRPVQEWNQGLGEGLDKGRELSERMLHQPSSPSGELNRADFNIGWQAVGPVPKNQSAGSRVWEAKQTKTGLGARFVEWNPGVKSGGGC